MAKDKNQFLKFSPYSMKEYIVRKLSEDPTFTDQIYPGSNLQIIIDLVSYMYQCLVFQLNQSAAESMFADTQLFENIVRLVSMLGYQARGCSPSTIAAYVQNTDASSDRALLPYTRFSSGLTGSDGRQIMFSVGKQNTTDGQTVYVNAGAVSRTFFANGQFKMYPTVFTASGLGNETFVLTGLKSDSAVGKYVAQEYIDVWVESRDGTLTAWNYDANGIFTRSRNLDDLTVENSFYGSGTTGGEDRVYTAYLNQGKEYEIKFGDGVVGQRLAEGDRVIVMYLDTNGPDGEVDVEDVDFSSIRLEHSAASLGMSKVLYDRMFSESERARNIAEPDEAGAPAYSVWADAVAASEFEPEQSVQKIRENAPNWFKTGNRLITKSDYEYFVKNNRNLLGNAFAGQPVADVLCMNNAEYAATFYKWLYVQGRDNGLSRGGKHYFDPAFWNRSDYAYVDPADGNNTYLWIKTKNSEISEKQDDYDVGELERSLNEQLKPMKTLTTEIKVLKPVYVRFDVCARPIGSDEELAAFREEYLAGGGMFDENLDSYIEITLDDNTLYASTSIQSSVYNIIANEFNINNCGFGRAVSYDGMLNRIYGIAGVRNVRTVYAPGGQLKRAYDGLSFVSWSPLLDDGEMSGVDLSVSNSVRALEPFQFPVFTGRAALMRRIRVIKRSMAAINTLKA